jgi:hypothetical protein
MRVAAAARSLARLAPSSLRSPAHARPLHAPSPALRRGAHASASAGMDAMERYFFDLNGFIVVPQARPPACSARRGTSRVCGADAFAPCRAAFRQVFTPDEVAACHAAIDAREAAFKARRLSQWLRGPAGANALRRFPRCGSAPGGRRPASAAR